MFKSELRLTSASLIMLQKFPEDARRALFNAMVKASKFLEVEVKKSFGQSGYPNIRTGNLKRSIYNRAFERASEVVGAVGATALYAGFLEDGTRRMRARPFLRPAITRNSAQLSRIITDSIAEELNK